MDTSFFVAIGILSFLVLFAILVDVELNPKNKTFVPNRVDRYKRARTWIVLGFVYAAFYTFRYSILAAPMYSQSSIGQILTATFWFYVLIAIPAGILVDRIGGKTSVIVSLVGTSTISIITGIVFLKIDVPNEAIIAVLFSISILFQSIGANGAVKINSSMYNKEEKGVFSGNFNTILSTGYFMAITCCPLLIDISGWSSIFFYIAGMMIILLLLIILFIETPPPLPKSIKIINKTTILEAFKVIGLVNLLAVMSSSWVRDGFLTLVQVYEYNIVYGAAIAIGSAIGGMIVGYLFDFYFTQEYRRPIILFGIGIIACMFLFAYFPNIALVGILFIFVSGVYNLTAFTIPSSAPTDIVGLVSGLVTSAIYISSGISCLLVTNTYQPLGWIGGWIVPLTIPISLTVLAHAAKR